VKGEIFSDSKQNTSIIVTTYNPEVESLKKNLTSYAFQVGMVLICDNSEISSIQRSIENLVIEFANVTLISMDGNQGIAIAQNHGIRYALNKGFKYFIEVDQDSNFPSDYVAKISTSYFNLIANGESVAGLGPLAVRADGFIYDGHRDLANIVRVDKTLSSGFFFPRSSFEIVGPKDESLFIDYVDWEWCWRSKSFGLDVFMDTNLRIEHMLGNGHRKIFYFDVGLPAPIRHYYQFRNSFYLLFRGYVPIPWKIKRVLINLFKFPIYSFLVGDGKLRRKYIGMAFKDVVAKKTGKIKL
jgi:rhamnosyltransferase